jgi:hypothetical protein
MRNEELDRSRSYGPILGAEAETAPILISAENLVLLVVRLSVDRIKYHL